MSLSSWLEVQTTLEGRGGGDGVVGGDVIGDGGGGVVGGLGTVRRISCLLPSDVVTVSKTELSPSFKRSPAILI